MKIDLGRINHLKVVKKVDFGFYLDGGVKEKSCCQSNWLHKDAR